VSDLQQFESSGCSMQVHMLTCRVCSGKHVVSPQLTYNALFHDCTDQ
jgi:hypothetical protein